MRTLAVMHVAEGGGPPQHVRPWLAALAKRGSLEVVAPDHGLVLDMYAPLGRTTVLPYAPLTFPANLGELVRQAWRFLAEIRVFRAHLRRNRPDLVVIVTSVLPSALVACRLTRTPVLVYACELLDRGSLRSRFGASISGLTARLASGVVCASSTVAEQFDRAGSRLVVTVYPGVDTSQFEGDRRRSREAFGVSAAQPCLAVLGNLTTGRGQDVVIRALSLLRAEFPDIHCLIAGIALDRPVDRAYETELRRLVAELGLDDAVSFVGFVDPVSDVYAAADLVVNPARVKEGFGRVAIEALAAGRPVIASRVGAIPEVLRDETDALLVEPGDPHALRDAVVRLWRDEALRSRLVASGRARVRSTFREDESVAAFCQVVDRVLAG